MSSQVFSGRYEMVTHIARGGMAQVYLARDLLLDRPVAVKVLFPELSVDRSFVERFRREAKAAANLTHPNIVSVYDWGQGEHTYFIVMEYVDGRTLSSIQQEGPIDAGRAAAIGADVAAALDFAHRRGVIHRDVKPANVLIDNASGQVKVTDFGIARAIGAGTEDLTQTGSVMGTATYFSPEQAQGYAVVARSDVYSLGVVLYQMVGGKPPFAGDSPVSIAYKHVKEEPVPPTSVNPAVPAGLEAIIMKALAKEPEARYQTAGELRTDLLRFGQGQPVAAMAEPTRVAAAVGGAAVATALAADPTLAQGATRVTPVRPAGYGADGSGPEEPSRHRWWWPALVVAVLVALAAGVFFLGRARGWWDSTRTLTVPHDVVGKPAATAMTELQHQGFSNVSTRSESSSVASGLVVTTDPVPGTSLQSNKPLVLLVSSGPVQASVPNVVGKSEADATAALKNAGFEASVTSATSTTVAANIVISTSPPAGTNEAKGSTVHLVVSSGRPLVTIPSLTNDLPIQAGQVLFAYGLKANQVSEPSPSIPAGQVSGTNPPEGAQVPYGSTVTVFVSTGLPQVTVPSLTGDTKAAASAKLQTAGLGVNFTTTPVPSAAQNGLVQSQSPGANQAVNKGSVVSVVIGSYTAPTTTSTTSTTTPSTTTTVPTPTT